jgi:hypothetical protein
MLRTVAVIGAGTIVVVVAAAMLVILLPGVTVDPATIGRGASIQSVIAVSVAAVDVTTRIKCRIDVRFFTMRP